MSINDDLAVTVLRALIALGGRGTSWQVTARANRDGPGPEPVQVQETLRQMELAAPPLAAPRYDQRPAVWYITAAGTAALARPADR